MRYVSYLGNNFSMFFQASGGWPEPHLSAHLGGDPEDPEASEKGFGFELEYDAERDEKGENEDGTVTLTRYFKLNVRQQQAHSSWSFALTMQSRVQNSNLG